MSLKAKIIGAIFAAALVPFPSLAGEGAAGHGHDDKGVLDAVKKRMGGGHDDEEGHGHAANIGKPGDPEKAARTVEIRMSDNFYNLERLEVRRGETVRFVVINDGALLHEFNIADAASHAAHQREMQTMMEHGMITPLAVVPEKMAMDHGEDGEGHAMTHDDPNSVLLAAGESGEIVWTFEPEEGGELAKLEFACNVPGHYAAGMTGEITVAE